MRATVVPVIYDRATKKVKRWFLLDFESQRNDPAFKPSDPTEAILNIPLGTYRQFGASHVANTPDLRDLQSYVSHNAA